jgi:hypothetical protein
VRNVNYAATSDTSKISTEMMLDDYPLLDMDVIYAAPSDSPVYVGTINSCKNEKTTHAVSFELNNEVEDPIVISSPISTEMLVDDKPLLEIEATPNTCNKKVNFKKLQLVEHNAVVRSKMNSMLKTGRYQSDESRAIIRCALKKTLTEVLLTIYTIYHSPLSTLPFFLVGAQIYGGTHQNIYMDETIDELLIPTWSPRTIFISNYSFT